MSESETSDLVKRHELAFKLKADSLSLGRDLNGVAWIPLDAKSMLNLNEAGADIFVPPLFYDNDKYNHISLEIYHTLRQAFAECDTLLAETGASRYRNFVAIFFQEILRILCSYYFKRYEIEHLSSLYEPGCDGLKSVTPSGFPYVDYDFVFNPEANIGPELFEPRRQDTGARVLASNLRDFSRNVQVSLRGNKKRMLLYTSDIGVDIRPVTEALNRMQGEYVWQARLERLGHAKAFIPLVGKQVTILESCLSALESKLGLSLPDSVLKIISFWTKPFLAGCESSSWLPDALLTGSQTGPETRVVSAKYRSKGVPVLSLFHGEACGMFDEPVFGYGENSFADRVVGFGDIGCANSVGGQYLNSLFEDDVKYRASTSAKAARLCSQKPPVRLSEIESPRYMYVPTSFIENGRYGPFRDMHDVAYMRWQTSLMKLLGQLYPGRVMWKPHIKERTGIKLPYIPGIEVLTGLNFEDAMGRADAFIFDYVSTAFTLAAATPKPVVYLDIGLRNFTALGIECIRNRCLYVQADPQEPERAFRQALDMADKQCTNRYTPNFSLSNDVRPRYEIVAEVIDDMVEADSRLFQRRQSEQVRGE